ncbi:MAG TPA: MoaD/ThiS family protein [Gemmatimonas sp.]|nr:MoaD/ThiS family protein [Gemmatimonas sp.]
MTTSISHPTGIPVFLFASYADAFGARQIRVPVEMPCRARDIVEAMRAMPGGARLPDVPLLALNQSWIDLDEIVNQGDEVALIPPVAGG